MTWGGMSGLGLNIVPCEEVGGASFCAHAVMPTASKAAPIIFNAVVMSFAFIVLVVRGGFMRMPVFLEMNNQRYRVSGNAFGRTWWRRHAGSRAASD